MMLPQLTRPRVDIGPMRPGEVADVARLHHEFFGGDAHGHALARLGARFLAEVFYRPNRDNPYFFCDVARVDGALAAFSVYVSDGQRVFRHTLTRHPFAILGGVLRQFARQPVRTAAHVAGNLAYIGGRTIPEVADAPGVYLLLAIGQPYRSREFRERAGVWLAGELWSRMEATLRAAGCPAFWSAPGAHNAPINQLFKTFGAAEVARGAVQGIACVYYRKSLRAEPVA
jgi:hypothetical protein